MVKLKQFQRKCSILRQKKMCIFKFCIRHTFALENKNKANKLHFRTLFKDTHGETWADKTQEIQMWK